MASAEPHANYEQHMANIEAAVEGEREAMVAAEAETRRATRKWRQFSVWLAHDSKARKLPAGSFSRRLVDAKLVWWASKNAAASKRTRGATAELTAPETDAAADEAAEAALLLAVSTASTVASADLEAAARAAEEIGVTGASSSASHFSMTSDGCTMGVHGV